MTLLRPLDEAEHDLLHHVRDILDGRVNSTPPPRIVVDGYGLLNPSLVKRWADAQGFELVGICAYLQGDVGLCGWGTTPTSAGRAWLAAMESYHLSPVFLWELSPSAPEAGAAQGIHDAGQAGACLSSLAPFGLRKSPGEGDVFFANDSIVTNWPAVEDYYAAVAWCMIADGWRPAEYGQAQVFEKIAGYGVKMLFKAPDGTEQVPHGTVMVQHPNAGELADGAEIDVDVVLAEDFGGWSFSG